MAALNGYSWFDRLTHRIAFSSPGVQIAAAEIEDGLFRRELDQMEVGAPVFITSLPRAGTTILLTSLSSVPELGSHTYRDMPFVMAPLLWSRLSGHFRKPAVRQERAHDDGVTISYDSPEAFEEVIWRAFWPEHFKADGICLGSAADAKEEAREFMLRHFRKIAFLRSSDLTRPGRYLSKNNGNAARLSLILRMFPDATILVPVRTPMAHATSLHRQHLNFLRRQDEDAFVRRYMSDIGHYEFGMLHRPIRFEGLDELVEGHSPADLDYWLAYWIAAFEHIARHRDSVCILGYESLCQHANAAAAELCEVIGIAGSAASEIARYFRPAAPLQDELDAYRGPLRDRAEAVHANLINS
jgi:hypothetical protein